MSLLDPGPDAARLLVQATMGATAAEIDRVVAMGAGGWVDDQLARPARPAHVADVQAQIDAAPASATRFWTLT